MTNNKQPQILLFLMLSTALFNICDYFFTLKALERGYEEANPIMDTILHTPLFPIYKLLIVPSLLILIWVLREKVGKRLIFYVGTVFVAYFSLMIYFAVVIF